MSTNPHLQKYTREELIRKIQAMPDGNKKILATELAALKFASKIDKTQTEKFKPYKYRPVEYISTFLKWIAWTSTDDENPGQTDILEACARVMLQQEEKDLFEKGELREDELTVWSPVKGHPDNIIKNWIRVESGNGIGKTKSSSGILNWFLDCFCPSAIFTFAPGGDQARFAMWAEIRKDREGKGLPGRILETEIKVSGYHFAAHRTVSDGLGKGEERIKGKHEAFQLFIIDEADGVPDFVFSSISTMTSGGNSLVIMFANPKSRATMFHKLKDKSYVQNFRISTLQHPNVVLGYEEIPHAVKRSFVEREIENNCDILHVCRDGCDEKHENFHNADDFTFELKYGVQVGEAECPAGTIFRPNPNFMTTILGITPPNSADDTVIPIGRYEGAKKRVPEGDDPTRATVGLDAAWMGSDMGKMYVRWQDAVWLACEFFKQRSDKYVETIREECLKLPPKGVTKLHIRIDAGYGNAIIDALLIDDDLIKAFEEYEIFTVHFGSTNTHNKEYYDTATEMYFETAESLKGLSILTPSETLEVDLCERKYNYRNVSGKLKKKLEEKPEFKKRKKRSPDDGDGFVLAVAPDYCFNKLNFSVVSSVVGKSPSVVKTDPLGSIMNRLLNKKG